MNKTSRLLISTPSSVIKFKILQLPHKFSRKSSVPTSSLVCRKSMTLDDARHDRNTFFVRKSPNKISFHEYDCSHKYEIIRLRANKVSRSASASEEVMTRQTVVLVHKQRLFSSGYGRGKHCTSHHNRYISLFGPLA